MREEGGGGEEKGNGAASAHIIFPFSRGASGEGFSPVRKKRRKERKGKGGIGKRCDLSFNRFSFALSSARGGRKKEKKNPFFRVFLYMPETHFSSGGEKGRRKEKTKKAGPCPSPFPFPRGAKYEPCLEKPKERGEKEGERKRGRRGQEVFSLRAIGAKKPQSLDEKSPGERGRGKREKGEMGGKNEEERFIPFFRATQ